jgi:hypothetical protein
MLADSCQPGRLVLLVHCPVQLASLAISCLISANHEHHTTYYQLRRTDRCQDQ